MFVCLRVCMWTSLQEEPTRGGKGNVITDDIGPKGGN